MGMFFSDCPRCWENIHLGHCKCTPEEIERYSAEAEKKRKEREDKDKEKKDEK